MNQSAHSSARRASTITVGIADMQVSSGASTSLITHALGSCLGIVVHDPRARVSGMLHVMLPTSRIDPERAKASPMMYVDTGLPRLFRKAYMLGAKKQNIEVTVAGGASSLPGMSGRLRIGARNFSAVRRCLFQNGVLIRAHDVGGTAPRTMVMRVDTGAVLIRSNGREYSL